ncbi:MAG: hypothetical protein AABW58_01450 [Nanoarchaeota archaeon]
MSLVSLATSGTGDPEVDRAISLWRKVKEDHKNLADIDAPNILTQGRRDDYLARFMSAQAVGEEVRRCQEILSVYDELENEFAGYIADRVARSIKNLRRKTYVEIGKVLLKEKGV